MKKNLNMRMLRDNANLFYLFYNSIILLITIYGYQRIMVESYCMHSRPGHISSKNTYFEVSELKSLWTAPGYIRPIGNSTDNDIEYVKFDFDGNKTEYHIGEKAYSLWASSMNETGVKRVNYSYAKSHSTFDLNDMQTILNLNFFKDKKYFSLRCINWGGNSTSWSMHQIDDEGFLFNYGLSRGEGVNVMTCYEKIHDENCLMRDDIGDAYLIATFIILSFFLLVILLFPYIDFFKEKVHVLLGFLGCKSGLFKYCNPLTDSFGEIHVGDDIFVFGFQDNLDCPHLNIFSNSLIEINLCGQFLSIKYNGFFRSLKISHLQSNNMGKFIYKIFESEKNWVSNGLDHYLEVSVLFEKLELGYFITMEKCEKELVLKSDICKHILKNVSNWKTETIDILCKHNKEFFGKHVDNLLMKIQKGKTNWYDKPSNVGNSEWKRYVSDTSNIILKMEGSLIKTQYRKAKPLTDAAKKAITTYYDSKNQNNDAEREKEEDSKYIEIESLKLDRKTRMKMLEGVAPEEPNLSLYQKNAHKDMIAKNLDSELFVGRPNLSKFFSEDKGFDIDVTEIKKEMEEAIGHYKTAALTTVKPKTYKEALEEMDKKLKHFLGASSEEKKVIKKDPDFDKMINYKMTKKIDYDLHDINQYELTLGKFDYLKLPFGLVTKYLDELVRIEKTKEKIYADDSMEIKGNILIDKDVLIKSNMLKKSRNTSSYRDKNQMKKTRDISAKREVEVDQIRIDKNYYDVLKNFVDDQSEKIDSLHKKGVKSEFECVKIKQNNRVKSKGKNMLTTKNTVNKSFNLRNDIKALNKHMSERKSDVGSLSLKDKIKKDCEVYNANATNVLHLFSFVLKLEKYAIFNDVDIKKMDVNDVRSVMKSNKSDFRRWILNYKNYNVDQSNENEAYFGSLFN